MTGPPGSGKTLLARALSAILPRMTIDEALDVTRIYSVADQLPPDVPLVRSRPFRSPHHTISHAGLVGGGNWPRPGEISLAHRGVLFLDELPEFSMRVLEVMRQPIEDKVVTISRASGSLTFPASFQLIAAMNPCPCGYHGDRRRACRCSALELLRYRRRISGPLLDRIDLHVDVPALPQPVLGCAAPGPPSAEVRDRVTRARAAQAGRAEARGARCNARLRGTALRRLCAPDEAGRSLLARAVEKLGLSARGHDKVLRVARTIADLEGADAVRAPHVAEAIQYRALDRPLF